MQLSKIKEFSLSLCNNTENHDYMDHTESLLNMLYKTLIVCTPLSAGTGGGGGWGVAGKGKVDFFKGGVRVAIFQQKIN